MKVEVPTPPEGVDTVAIKRSKNGRAMTIMVPMTVIGGGVLIALGWAWNIDKSQAVDHQRIDDLKTDVREALHKLDDLKDLIINRKP